MRLRSTAVAVVESAAKRSANLQPDLQFSLLSPSSSLFVSFEMADLKDLGMSQISKQALDFVQVYLLLRVRDCLILSRSLIGSECPIIGPFPGNHGSNVVPILVLLSLLPLLVLLLDVPNSKSNVVVCL